MLQFILAFGMMHFINMYYLKQLQQTISSNYFNGE